MLDGESNDILDELMQHEGLEEVKQHFLDIKSKVDICKKQGRDLKSERFNIVLQGNPGTGKTTVARLYARFLHSMGVLPSSYVKETSGVKLATQGAHYIKRKLKLMVSRDDQGGVLFVDEAYQLVAPYVDGAGRPVLDVILTAMENHIGNLVVIFVGYKDEMEAFFEHNPGLTSRIPCTINFADFTNAELWKILSDNIVRRYNGKMEVEGGMGGLYMRIAIRRLAQGRGNRSFGNARAVQNLLDLISRRQARRLNLEKRYGGKRPDYFLFTKEDLIGPDPSLAATQSDAWSDLQKLIGLKQVKDRVGSMVRMLELNYRRELCELSPLRFTLNQLFVGAPGTGKTTVAKLYGRILADLGYLSRGDVVLKTPADFIGECLGKSEAKTKKILDATVGKILVIDEAYMLDAGDPNKEQDKFKTGVIDTMVSMVQGHPGEDRCIVLVGYEDKIRDLFHNANPGLARRFPTERPFRFENFNTSQLEQIMLKKMHEQDLSCTGQALAVARDVFERALMRPNFTNAGEVDNLLAAAKVNFEMRQSQYALGSQDVSADLEAQDFDPDFDRGSRSTANCRKMLEGRVDQKIIDRLVGYQNRYTRSKELGLSPRVVPTNFIFSGFPGTGKTTTAQQMGQIFYDMGFLSTPEVIECSAADLVGQYVGQTTPKTRRKLEDAVGRVLFIDEAYRLIYGQYAAEAVDELIHFLSQESHQGSMVVILAGYTADMNCLLSTRPNLSSLFPEEIVFNNIPPDDCITLLVRELQTHRIISEGGLLTDPSCEGYKMVRRLFRALMMFPTWSNARDVKHLAKQMLGLLLDSDDYLARPEPALSLQQITHCMAQMIGLQRSRCNALGSTANMALPQQLPLLEADGSQLAQSKPQLAAPPTPSTSAICAGDDCSVNAHVNIDSTRTAKARVQAQTNFSSTASSRQGQSGVLSTTIREQGVPEAVWQDLIAAKKTQAAQRTRDIATRDRLTAVSPSSRGGGNGSDTASDVSNELSVVQRRMQEEDRVQYALNAMNRCVNGYSWVRVAGGYRCEGGMHFVSNDELRSSLL
ncbi:P-loop containing nucleoside triphosphate hydrolase protein [Aspergillus falconensis]